MFKKLKGKTKALCGFVLAITVFMTQFVYLISSSADTPKITKVITDTFEYEANRFFDGNSTYSKSTIPTLVDGAAHIKTTSNSQNFYYIPIDSEGNPYEVSVSSGDSVKYIIKFDYKYISGRNIWFKSALIDVNAKSNQQYLYTKVGSNVNTSVLETWDGYQGIGDGKWHTAYVPFDAKANKNYSNAGIGFFIDDEGGSEFCIDNFEVYKVESSAPISNILFQNTKVNPVSWVTGENADVLPVPTQDGYVFDGWYSDPGLTDRVTKIPANNVSGGIDTVKLYAKFTAIGDAVTTVLTDDFEREDLVYKDTAAGGGTAEIVSDNGDKVLQITHSDSSDAKRVNVLPKDKENGNLKIEQGKTYRFIVSYRYKTTHADFADEPLIIKPRVSTLQSDLIASASGSGNLKIGDIIGQTPPVADGDFYENKYDDWQYVGYPVTVTGGEVDGYFSLMFESDQKGTVYIDDITVYSVLGETGITVMSLKNADAHMRLFSWIAGDKIENVPTIKVRGYDFMGWHKTVLLDGKLGAIPAMGAGDNYISLYADYQAVTPTVSVIKDTFEYGDVSNRLYSTDGLSTAELESGTGYEGSTAFVVSQTKETSAVQARFVPRNDDGSTYTEDIVSGQTVKFIIKMNYRMVEGNSWAALYIKTALVNTSTGKDYLAGEGLICGAGTSTDKLGNYGFINGSPDKQWHTAYIPVTMTAKGNYDDAAFGVVFDSPYTGVFAIDNFEVYRVRDTATLNTVFFKVSGMDSISWIAGDDFELPELTKDEHKFEGWYTDAELTKKYIGEGFPEESLTLYPNFVRADGFYAVEHFDKNEEIWINQLNSMSRGDIWEQYGTRAKMIQFTFSDTVRRGDSGRSLAYILPSGEGTYSTIILTNNVDDQIYLGSANDEKWYYYVVSFWYKIVKAETDLEMSVMATTDRNAWENLGARSVTYKVPVLSTCDWTQATLLLPAELFENTYGQTEGCLGFSITGNGEAYFDDFEVTKVKLADGSSKAQEFVFDTDGGSLVAPTAGAMGDTIKMPANPTKKDCTFDGWYYDLGYEQKFTATTFGEGGTTYLFAKWNEIEGAGGGSQWGDITDYDDGATDIWEDEKIPIYEDIYEDILENEYLDVEVPYQKKGYIVKTVTEGGIPDYVVIIIIACCVVVAGGVVTTIVMIKRKKNRKI